jgi:hypothetical protein
MGAHLENQFLFLFLRIVFENKNEKKKFVIFFFAKEAFVKLFLKTVAAVFIREQQGIEVSVRPSHFLMARQPYHRS